MKYAVIGTYVNGTAVGAVINAASNQCAWVEALKLFGYGEYIQSIQVSAILTEDCGGEFKEEKE